MRVICLTLFLGALVAPGVLAQDVSDGELASEMRFQGGQSVFHYDWQRLTGDLTCDGAADKVAGYVDLDNPEGLSFFFTVVTRQDGKLVSDATVTFFDERHDRGLCGEGKPPPVLSLERLTPEEARELTGKEDACPVVVRIDDGLCAAHRYFWSAEPDRDDRLMPVKN
ncbi:hypothetical protein [Nisaea sediminum]|uniref:hypothetical protein n=1 Tax=Nisaea sediminum TaxID=2775867 RepID=UPI0018669BC4|nr:hypothetical protein [Nisaea sediminum]